MISAALIGGSVPADVQIVVDMAPVGVPWTLTGSAAGTTWMVPGGAGIGDGGQVARVDNRTPGNVPIVYTFSAGATVETSSPVTVAIGRDAALQTLDGSASVIVELVRPSLDTHLAVNAQAYTVAGRRRPVIRHDVTGSGGGSFVVRAFDPEQFDAVMASGGPIVYRTADKPFDLPRVAVIQPLGLSSTAFDLNGFREWDMPFVFVDDPYLDVVLGGFSWNEFEDAWAGQDWDGFDTRMTGLTWDQFDAFDWSLL